MIASDPVDAVLLQSAEIEAHPDAKELSTNCAASLDAWCVKDPARSLQVFLAAKSSREHPETYVGVVEYQSFVPWKGIDAFFEPFSDQVRRSL